jgi:hypothetical protein
MGGGVMIYAREALQPIERDVQTGCEMLNIEIGSGKRLNILNIYRPPNQNLELDEEMFRQLNISLRNKNTIIVGDFNCPSINWQKLTSNTEDSKMLNFVLDEFLIQFVKEPTRGNNTLDLVLGTDEDIVTGVEVKHPLGSSDHNIVEFQIKMHNTIKKASYQVLNYRKADWGKLRGNLSTISNSPLGTTNIEEIWGTFKNTFLDMQSESIPKIKIDPNRVRLPAWMSDNIKKIAAY